MACRRSGFAGGDDRPRATGTGFVWGALLVAVWVGASASSAVAGEVVGAKRSKVYHIALKECHSARNISPENRIRFASAEEAEKAGRRLCKRCAVLAHREQSEKKKSDTEGTDRKGLDRERAGHRGLETTTTQPARVTADVDVPEFVALVEVLAGGTMGLDVDEKARLLGVVCPGGGQPYAEDAVRFIKEQTQGRRVRMARDVSPGPIGHRDTLGRLLVYMKPEPDGRDLGAELIFQGYAWLDRQARFQRRAEYARREEEAWRAGRGIWKPSKGAAGKRKVVTGRHAQYYHDAKCPHASHLAGKITLTLNEARSRRLPPCAHYRVKGKVKGKSKDKGKDDQRS